MSDPERNLVPRVTAPKPALCPFCAKAVSGPAITCQTCEPMGPAFLTALMRRWMDSFMDGKVSLCHCCEQAHWGSADRINLCGTCRVSYLRQLQHETSPAAQELSFSPTLVGKFICDSLVDCANLVEGLSEKDLGKLFQTHWAAWLVRELIELVQSMTGASGS